MKKYYCDYCDRYFTDSQYARKKHNATQQHQVMVKLHYDSFKDPSMLLQEAAGKTPCPSFLETGTCPWGTACRFSHLPQHFPFPDQLPSGEAKKIERIRVDVQLPSNLPPSMTPPPVGGWDYSQYPAHWG